MELRRRLVQLRTQLIRCGPVGTHGRAGVQTRIAAGGIATSRHGQMDAQFAQCAARGQWDEGLSQWQLRFAVQAAIVRRDRCRRERDGVRANG